MRNEDLSAAELERLIDERSTRIAVHAFDRSPFYRDLYSAAGFTRADVSESRNFTSLPVVTKGALRAVGDEVLARGVDGKRALRSQTGGSTGAPLHVRNDAAAPTAAMWWRMYRWWGVHPADDTAFIYRRMEQGKQAVLRRLQWWPSRHIHLDARAITEESAEEFLAAWHRVQPDLLIAYVEGATAVAAQLQRSGRQLQTTAVSVTAAMLQPGQRDLIQQTFNAPVYDTYRSAEIPWIAAECGAHRGLHIAADQRRVEIVDEHRASAAAGELGTVLVTDFSNEVFPLIRYEMGDRSRMLEGECPCGLPFARIDPVQGRVADVLRTPSGKQVTGGLSGLFLDAPGSIRQMQVIQHPDFSVTLRYVPLELHTAEIAAATAARTLRALLDDEASVTAVAVEAIESSGGKARLVISELSG